MPKQTRLPNKSVRMTGFVTDKVMCQKLAMIDSTHKTVLPSGVELTPSLVNYHTDYIEIDISNHSSHPVVVPPRGFLCELQEVEVVEAEVGEGEGPTGLAQDTESQEKMTCWECLIGRGQTLPQNKGKS